MDRGNVRDLTQCGGAPGHQDAASSAFSFGQERPSEETSGQHGRIATVIKGVFKIYLVPAMRAQNALATVTGGWSDLVAEARQERETGNRTDDLKMPDAAPATAARASATPVAETGEAQRSTPRPPGTPGGARKPRATGARRRSVAVPHDGDEGIIESSLTVPGPVQTERSEPPPTLVETGESSVEVRPNPAISPPHVTSGVLPHLPPEVRHKLAGNGPIRA